MLYFVKKPKWIRSFYGDCVWEINTAEKKLYLTFDDGPDPVETPFVLDLLAKYNAKATFFCLGQNVLQYPSLFEQIISEGHSTGNHSFSHLDGWRSSNEKYFNDIAHASTFIPSKMFRPPYGHITWKQVKRLHADMQMKTILWNVLSADFDEKTSKEKCLSNVIDNAGPGAIVLFHDNALASRNMRYALAGVLDHFSKEGYRFEAIAV